MDYMENSTKRRNQIDQFQFCYTEMLSHGSMHQNNRIINFFMPGEGVIAIVRKICSIL